MDNIFDLSGSEFRLAIKAMNNEELTQFIHDMKPAQRKRFLDNLENNEIKNFLDQIPKTEADRFLKLTENIVNDKAFRDALSIKNTEVKYRGTVLLTQDICN